MEVYVAISPKENTAIMFMQGITLILTLDHSNIFILIALLNY